MKPSGEMKIFLLSLYKDYSTVDIAKKANVREIDGRNDWDRHKIYKALAHMNLKARQKAKPITKKERAFVKKYGLELTYTEGAKRLGVPRNRYATIMRHCGLAGKREPIYRLKYPRDVIDKAIRIYDRTGSIAMAAETVGINYNTVHNWCHGHTRLNR